MKKLKIITLLAIGLISFNSCESDDSLTFIAQPAGEFSFSNSFSQAYVLTPATSGNLGERFTWDDADFGVQTTVNYELQRSIIGDFSDMAVVGTTNENEIAVTIGNLLLYANEAGLDNDPATDNPNTGLVHFRLRAHIGVGESTENTEMISSAQALTLVLPENTGSDDPVCEFEQLWAVGAGVPDAGWGWTTPVQLPCTGDGVYSWNINLQNLGGAEPNNNFRFFTSEGDWASGLNYPYFADAGYDIDPNFVNAADGDSNFAFVGTTGFYYVEIDTVNKTIIIGEPQATGVCEFEQLWIVGAGVPDAGWGWTSPVQLLCTGEGIYSGNVNFQNNGGADNNFRFFTVEGDWASGRNYPYYENEGFTFSDNLVNAADDDNNFAFTGTTGTYFLTVNTVAKTITIE